MQGLGGFFFLLFILLVGIVPFFLIYPFSALIRFLLFHVIKYRRKVVLGNLRAAFPEKSPEEISRLMRRFYKNLADILLEGIKAFTMTRNQIIRRHRLINPELVKPYLEQGKSLIVLPAHFTNWEWGSMSGGLQLKHPTVGFYKPLTNPWIDRFARWSRSKYGTDLVSIRLTAQEFERNKEKSVIYIMAADQSPNQSNKIVWTEFLGLETAFLYGPEKYARRYDLPVFFVDIQRIKRGFYELTISLLTDRPKDLPDGEITRLYAASLERVIRLSPENWLWSHRRWKFKKPS